MGSCSAGHQTSDPYVIIGLLQALYFQLQLYGVIPHNEPDAFLICIVRRLAFAILYLTFESNNYFVRVRIYKILAKYTLYKRNHTIYPNMRYADVHKAIFSFLPFQFHGQWILFA